MRASFSQWLNAVVQSHPHQQIIQRRKSRWQFAGASQITFLKAGFRPEWPVRIQPRASLRQQAPPWVHRANGVSPCKGERTGKPTVPPLAPFQGAGNTAASNPGRRLLTQACPGLDSDRPFRPEASLQEDEMRLHSSPALRWFSAASTQGWRRHQVGRRAGCPWRTEWSWGLFGTRFGWSVPGREPAPCWRVAPPHPVYRQASFPLQSLPAFPIPLAVTMQTQTTPKAWPVA